MQVLGREELQRFLLQAQAEGCFELFLLDLCTGLRRGKLLALQWGDLDFDAGTLTVEKQVYAVKGQLQLSVPKTKASIRKLVLPPGVVEVLREYRRCVDSRWMFPSPVKEDTSLSPARPASGSGRFWSGPGACTWPASTTLVTLSPHCLWRTGWT